MTRWRAMMYAPRDGTPIIALHSDRSGALMVRWGEAKERHQDGWFDLEWEDCITDADSYFAGWIPAPEGKYYGDE